MVFNFEEGRIVNLFDALSIDPPRVRNHEKLTIFNQSSLYLKYYTPIMFLMEYFQHVWFENMYAEEYVLKYLK